MKTEDLRRGNLILTSKDAGGKRFLRSIVEEIKADAVVVRGDRVVKIEDCEGIPLDEDWLLKFGFENKGEFVNKVRLPGNSSGDMDGATQYLKHPSWTAVYIEDGKFYYEIATCDDDIEYAIKTREIPYVHSIQNIHYDLEGEELKINSEKTANIE